MDLYIPDLYVMELYVMSVTEVEQLIYTHLHKI